LCLDVAATKWNATLVRRCLGDWLGVNAAHPLGRDLIFVVYGASTT
jgi:hypothetical protein